MGHIVNTWALSGAGLERALVDALVGILRNVGWLGDVRVRGPQRSTADGADAIVHVGLTKGREVEFRVYAKKEVRPSAFLGWAALRRHASEEKTIPVLAMPFVSSRLADLCQEAGWSWYDLAGNCRIDVPGSLHLERRGIAPVQRPPRSGANLGTAAAARVLRALLSPAHAGKAWTQRRLQEDTIWKFFGKEQLVSLGLVNKVIRHLRDEGFVEEVDVGGVRVRDPGGLLTAWNTAYRFDVHERRSYFSLLKGAQLHDALYRVGAEAGGMAVYAVFSAAERQAPHVRQPKTWLYVGPEFLDSLTRHTQAKQVDSGENLVVLVPTDLGVFLSFDADSHVGTQSLGCTDPVQTYVDLSHSGGRGDEAAQAMLDQKILPAWKAVGLA